MVEAGYSGDVFEGYPLAPVSAFLSQCEQILAQATITVP